jgi:hypothetical protein
VSNTQGNERNRSSATRPPTPGIPVAEMRSNDAPQDDSMPVGNMVGLARSPERGGESQVVSARTAATNLSRALLRDALVQRIIGSLVPCTQIQN